MNSIKDLVIYLKREGCELIPCTNKEVADLESYFGAKFPIVYKEFLLAMGKGADRYMRGSNIFFDKILKLKSWARDLIRENGLNPLPETAFVFWMHQGYQMAFFKLNEGGNPPVYICSETEDDMNDLIVVENLLLFFNRELISSGFKTAELS